MNYNFLKSKTFWTLVVTFLYNVWQLAMPSVPVQYSAVFDTIFTIAATYFHVSGVNTAALASAGGAPASGQ